jgi:hypothetical protein
MVADMEDVNPKDATLMLRMVSGTLLQLIKHFPVRGGLAL